MHFVNSVGKTVLLKNKKNVDVTLTKQAPSPFINKTITKEIMKRSRLRNKFLNTKSEIDRKACNKHHTTPLPSLEKQNKYSLAMLIQLM